MKYLFERNKMAIEFFRKGGKGFSPKASLRRQGQIGLSHGAIEKFNIKDGQHVLLGYDKDKKLVAIKCINEEEEGAKKVIVKGRSASIAAKAFLDYFGIIPKETKPYLLREDLENKWLVIDLKQEIEGKASSTTQT